MSRDNFIIMVYCWVCDIYGKIVVNHRLRQRGVAPTLSDEEAITMEICGEYFGFGQDKQIYDYFDEHYRHFFPQLPGRTSFVRQLANLWEVKFMIQYYLTLISGQADGSVQIIDTMPLPVCVYTRSRRDRCFKGEADYGYCAAKELHYYGFKLGLRLSLVGMILSYPLLPARPHDSKLLDDLIAGVEGVVLADKGFIDTFRQEQLALKRSIELITPKRKNMASADEEEATILKSARQKRKLVETVGSQLTERFHIAQTRAHDLWHYQNRLIRKVLAHTMGVFINLLLGFQPLHLADLITP